MKYIFTLQFVHHIFLTIIESHLCHGSGVLVRVKNIFIVILTNYLTIEENGFFSKCKKYVYLNMFQKN